MGEACKLKDYYIGFATLFLVPVLWIKTIKKLTFINFIALGVIIFVLITIVYYDVFYIVHNTFDTREVKLFDFWEYPIFFGIAILNFEGNPSALNIQASMKHPRRFTRTLLSASSIIVLIVIIQGTLSYGAYGNYIEDLVTLNLPHTRLTAALRVFYALALIMSYPL